jgi:alkylhydroperoxidase family enzyme
VRAILAEDGEALAALDDHGHSERERAALAWADAIAWHSEAADDGLWREPHRAFTEPELVELGYSVAIILGQQHWLATRGVVEHL